MKRKILAIALSLALLSSLFVFAAPVSAGTEHISLDVQLTATGQVIDPSSIKILGNGRMMAAEWVTTYSVSGDWSGTCDFSAKGVRVLATGRTVFDGVAEFVLAGGTITIRGVGIQPGGAAGSGGDGYWTIISGTGDYANLHGSGTWGGETSAMWDFVGKVHIAPN